MGLVEAGLLNLGNGVGITVCLVTTPYTCRGLIREGTGRQSVDGSCSIIGTEVGRPLGLLEHAEEIHRHKSSVGDVEVEIGTDIGLRLSQLRIVIGLLGVLEGTAHIGIIDMGVVFHLVRTSVHRNVCMVFLGSVLESKVAPVHVRIEVRVGTIFKEVKLLLGICGRESVVTTGIVEGIGIAVTVYHVCEFRVELELMAVVHFDACLAFCATLCLHQYGTIDTLMAKKCRSSGILEDGNALHFLYTEAVDGTLVAIDKDENAFIVNRVITTNVKRSTLIFVAREAALR